MNGSTRTIIVAGVLGAAAAAGLAYIFTSERGKGWLERLPETVRALAREGQRLLGAVQEVTNEVERSLDQVQHAVEQVVDAAQAAAGEASQLASSGTPHDGRGQGGAA